jgi:hypothetical protein
LPSHDRPPRLCQVEGRKAICSLMVNFDMIAQTDAGGQDPGGAHVSCRDRDQPAGTV